MEDIKKMAKAKALMALIHRMQRKEMDEGEPDEASMMEKIGEGMDHHPEEEAVMDQHSNDMQNDGDEEGYDDIEGHDDRKAFMGQSKFSKPMGKKTKTMVMAVMARPKMMSSHKK